MITDKFIVQVKPSISIGELKIGMNENEIDKLTENSPCFFKLYGYYFPEIGLSFLERYRFDRGNFTRGLLV